MTKRLARRKVARSHALPKPAAESEAGVWKAMIKAEMTQIAAETQAQQQEVLASVTMGRPPLLGFTSEILRSMDEILVQRGSTYADFADNTQAMVDILRALGFQFPPHFTDQTIGALLHLAAKLSRIPQSPDHRDNWLDLANYGVLGLAMADRKRAQG